MTTEQAVRLCVQCESEMGKGIVDVGDHSCSGCGNNQAPHVYVPTDEAAVERAAIALFMDQAGLAYTRLGWDTLSEHGKAEWLHQAKLVLDAAGRPR